VRRGILWVWRYVLTPVRVTVVNILATEGATLNIHYFP
jgi:hypothetical protein